MLAAVFATLVIASEAHAADPWRPVFESCVSAGGDGGACRTIRAGSGIWQVAVSPDGRHAYGSAWSTSALIIFDRNPVTGALSQRFAGGCLSETGSDGQCVKVKGLTNPAGITVSPDGRHVYVASYRGGIAIFDRDPSNGDLAQRADAYACLSADTTTGAAPSVQGACVKGRAMAGLLTAELSPTGRELYATGASSFVTLVRDPASGLLTQPDGVHGCIEDNGLEGCADGRAINGGYQMTVAPDGRSIYLPSPAYHGVVLLDRDPGTGLVRQKDGTAGCLAGTSHGGACDVDPRLKSPQGTLVSPDGGQVYVSNVDGLLGFARAPDGRLSLQSCVNDSGTTGCARGRNLSTMSFSAASPDHQSIVVSNSTVGAGFSVFRRAADGTISQVDGPDACVSANGAALVQGAPAAGACSPVVTQQGHGRPVFTGDHTFTVASHHGSGSVTSFKRDFYPQCQNQSLTVTRDVAATLPLACGDRNGDALAFSISGNPIAGALGAIDQAGARVFYNPFSGFVGSDSLRYQASAAGLTSNEATMQLSVVPPPPPPPPKPRTVNSPVSYNWNVKGSRHRIMRLIVRRLPLGSTVTITCSGKRCPLKRLTIKRSRKSTMNVLNAKALRGKHKKRRSYRAGQTVDIRIAAPNMNTKLLRFKLRKGKVAKHRTYCVPLGAKRAQRGSC